MSNADDGTITGPCSEGGRRSLIDRVLERQAQAWREGLPVTVEELLAEGVLGDVRAEEVLDLIHNEVELRRERGEAPELAEYQRRFPALVGPLNIQWAVNSFLLSNSPGDRDAGVPAQPPVRLGRYEVLAKLGQGGVGVAYKARDPRLKRVVALKVLKAGRHADSQERARFRIEAEAIARVRHVNVVQVFDVGEVGGEPFIAMEYCEGGNLAARLKTAPLSPAEAVAVLRQVADGVAAAHATSVVHRDLKPANIFLQAWGEADTSTQASVATRTGSASPPPTVSEAARTLVPKVSDFGLAKLLDSNDGYTRTGAVMGTPAYMAPEQAFGNVGEVGALADVYALGAILYECLAGRPPFQGASAAEILDQVRTRDPVPPRQLVSGVPRDLETIALQCLQKDPARRYPSAAAVGEDLARFAEGRPVLARRIRRAERVRRWCIRNPLPAGLLGVVFGLLLILAVVFGVASSRLSGALETSRAAEREARLREADALVGEAHGTRLSRREGQRILALAALRKAAAIGHELGLPEEWFARLRNEAIAALALPDVHLTRHWPGRPAGTVSFSTTADHRLYARCDAGGVVDVCRMGEDTPHLRIPGDGQGDVHLSPDGRHLAIVRAKRGPAGGELWDIGGAEPVRRCMVRDAQWPAFVDRPEGRLVTFVRRDGSLVTHRAADGAVVGDFPPGVVRKVASVVPHPSQPLVALGSYYHNTIEVRDVTTGRVVARETPPWPGGSRPAWHPGGRFLCVAKCDFEGLRVYDFDPAAGALTYRRYVPCGQGDTAITFNETGDRMFTTGWDRKASVWDFYSGHMMFITRSQVVKDSVYPVFDSASGELALAEDPERPGELGTWAVADGREYRVIVPADPSPKSLSGAFAIHPQGRLAAQSSEDGLRLYDLATGEQLASLTSLGGDTRIGGGILFDEAGSLYLNCFAGFFRWPIRSDEREGWRVGPPERLPFKSGYHPIGASADGRVVAQAMYPGFGMEPAHAGGWILHPNAPEPRHVDAGQRYAGANVSPDGRLVSFSLHDSIAKVFTTDTGRLVWQSPQAGGVARFSRDGRRLFTGHSPALAYHVETWEPGPSLGPGLLVDTTRDNTVAVLKLESGSYRLVETCTGRELARLEDPDLHTTEARFTPDDTWLVAQGRTGLRVWDLRRIRRELAAMGLDWDAPPYPAAAHVPPVHIAARFVN